MRARRATPDARRAWASGLRCARPIALGVCLSTIGCESDRPTVDAAAVSCRVVIPQAAPAAQARWRVAGDSASRRVLDSYCARVGPAVALDAPTRASVPADTLVVVNWNMAHVTGNLRALVRDLRAGALTGFVPLQLVLLLQEAPRADARHARVPAAAQLPEGVNVSELDGFGGSDIVDVAREFDLHLLYAPSMRNGLTVADQGNAILSTLPLRELHMLELPAGIRRRVAVSAVIAWPEGGALRLVSAHLDNWSARQAIASFGAIRTRQARALAAMLPRDSAILLGGDLNTWARGPNEAAFRALRRQLPRPDTVDTTPTAVRLGVPRRLDYFMLRAPRTWHFEEWRMAAQYGSDHHPLIALLFTTR
ncbi:MAG TPA: endonuclease/exonuclease/phosphatase family protein [Longimicrobiales bacterium]|nr:endonuclease/exonuclease/phosphatase family protein [Longimicrobiales bacterium]